MYHQKTNVIGVIEKRITVEMSEEDAALFIKFRRFQGMFEMLTESGITDIKNGSMTLHFDSSGTVKNVQVIHNYYQ